MEEGATPELVRKCWEHQEKACTIMCGEQGEWVELRLHGQMRKIMCAEPGAYLGVLCNAVHVPGSALCMLAVRL